MILRVLILSVLISLSKSSDGDFMNAVRSLIYGNQSKNSSNHQFSEGETPGLLSQGESSYPHPPSFNSYPQFTVGISGGSGSACNLPQQIGTGPYRIPRWYFNPARMRCELFYWSGCCGNGNNFNTFQACQQVCEESPNPCAYGTSSTLIQCGPGTVLSQTCSGQQFCHVGASAQTTVCCNKPATNADRCHQPLNVGVGNANLPRWYFNPLNQQCQSCIYKGLQGNENNFISKQDCENSCLVNPCQRGVAYKSQGVTVQCSANNQAVCPAGYYCHLGADASTSVCCQALGGDPCGQPMSCGIGNAQLGRWYWDRNRQQCLSFVYKGQKGTQNNFLSKQDCERTCYEFENPCALGDPQMISPTDIRYCSTSNPYSCAVSYWCHIGATAETTLCCPGKVSPQEVCQQPLQIGNGFSNLQRWYYDPARQCCLQFSYKGALGNENNFLTKEACENQCVFINPCNSPISTPPQMCSIQNPNSCTGNCWCHIGATPATTVCCPSEGNPCDLPLNRGTGGSSLPRWYYNQQTGTCEPFNYCGMKGNQNNFLTKEMCEGMCAPNPCAEGRPFVGVDGRTQTCSASATLNTCPSTYWCHIGSDQTTTVCCPGASQNSCNLPMSTGEGNEQLERFYFDSATKTCKPFIYLGLKGNQNNFLTLRSCQLACQPLDNPCIGQPATTPSGQVLFCSATNKDTCPVNFWCHLGATPETTVCCPGATNPCSVPLAPGTGNSGLQRWYYNPDDRQCVSFQYNGRRGNQNNFLSQAECERTCPEQLCLLSIDRGACGGRQTRYAFNRQTSQCVPFEYTGCGGNLNNFQSMADCMATCGNVGFR